MYMKYDWFQMNRIEFVAKYILELHTSRLEEKKAAIQEVLSSIWAEMEIGEKYAVFSLLYKGRHHADTFHILLTVEEAFECGFSEKTINATYKAATGINYDTNYFKSI